MALKQIKPGSLEMQALAIRQESKKRIRKNYRDAGIMAAACVGFIGFYWSRAEIALAEALYANLELEPMCLVPHSKEGNAAEGKAVDAKEKGKAVDAKVECKAVDAKDCKVVDAKVEGKAVDAKMV